MGTPDVLIARDPDDLGSVWRDLTLSRAELQAEVLFLRQQLIIAMRHAKRRQPNWWHRLNLIVLARLTSSGQNTRRR